MQILFINCKVELWNLSHNHRGRYIGSASSEMLLQNASVVFALNLYALCTANPVAVMFAASTFLPELDFYYNGDYESWWDAWGKWGIFGVIGVAATVMIGDSCHNKRCKIG